MYSFTDIIDDCRTNLISHYDLFAKTFSSVFCDEMLSEEYVALAASNVPLVMETLNAFSVDDSMIARAATQLKSSINPGPDGIPSSFVKSYEILPIRHVFALSLTSGTFPSVWKNAIIFPVQKKATARMLVIIVGSRHFVLFQNSLS